MIRVILMLILDYIIPIIKGRRDNHKYYNPKDDESKKNDSKEKLTEQTKTYREQEEAKFNKHVAFEETRTTQKLLPYKKAISPHERDHERCEQRIKVERARIDVDDGITPEEKAVMKENVENFEFTFTNSSGQKESIAKHPIQKEKDPLIFKANKIIESGHIKLERLKSRLDVRIANYQRSVNRRIEGDIIEVKSRINLEPPLYWDRSKVFSSEP